MKILFIVYHDLLREARSQEIMECSRKLGETTIVSYTQDMNISGINQIVTGRSERKYLSFFKSAIKAIKNINPDVIILHDNYTAPLLLILKKFHKKVYIIYDSSELYIERRIPKSINQIKSMILEYFEKNYIKVAHTVIAANLERAQIMKDFFGLDEIPLIFDNIHKIEVEYSENNCNQKYGALFSKNRFNIVYGGGIAKERLTFELIEVLHKLGEEYQLIIVGNSSYSDRSKFEDLINNRSISNVVYLGYVSRNEWRFLLKKADISVSIFSKENLNNIHCASGKLYESLFENTPVLMSTNPPLKRLCEEHHIGVSTDNFIEGIKELKKNYNQYKLNVHHYIKNLDYNNRINNLANQLQQKIMNRI